MWDDGKPLGKLCKINFDGPWKGAKMSKTFWALRKCVDAV